MSSDNDLHHNKVINLQSSQSWDDIFKSEDIKKRKFKLSGADR